MSLEPVLSMRNRWLVWSVGATCGIALAAAVAGFVWFPAIQPGGQWQGMWDAICSAAGLVRPPPATTAVAAPAYKTSAVVVIPQMLLDASAEAIGHGATLAQRCAACHGARGVSEANAPNLAGQYAAVVYKELQDYASGARTNAIMAPLVTGLTDADMRDLAAYYAYLPRLTASPAPGAAPLIVVSGAPMRNIAPCAACHGRMANKTGSPWLDGQPETYIRTQLQAFASGERHNDISQQMRNVARHMTKPEIEAAARHYATGP